MTAITFHQLYQKIDDEARSAVIELLESMSHQLRFELGADLHIANDDVTVFVRCVRMDEQHFYYAGVVLAGVPAGREVADIPWGLRSSAGREIGQGVTGTGGHFGFYVSKRLAESSNPVMLWFGQTVAADAPREAPCVPRSAILEIARVLADFHQVNAGQEDQPIAAPALRRLDDARHDAWRCRATVGAAQAAEVHEALAAYAADDGPQPATDERWVHVQGDEVWLRFPAELVPYGVVRLLATTEDLLVGTCLVPLIKAKAVRYSQCPASWVVGDRDPRTLDWYAQPATVETLPWFAAGEVEALLQRADVRDHEELAGKVRELLELAQQREAEVSHDGI